MRFYLLNTLALIQITIRLPSETVTLKDLNNNTTRTQSTIDNEVTPESTCIGHTESDCRRISHGFYSLYCMYTGINYSYSLTLAAYAFLLFSKCIPGYTRHSISPSVNKVRQHSKSILKCFLLSHF